METRQKTVLLKKARDEHKVTGGFNIVLEDGPSLTAFMPGGSMDGTEKGAKPDPATGPAE